MNFRCVWVPFHLNTEPSLVVEGCNKCMPLFNHWKLFEVWGQVNLPIKNRYNCFAVLCTNRGTLTLADPFTAFAISSKLWTAAFRSFCFNRPKHVSGANFVSHRQKWVGNWFVKPLVHSPHEVLKSMNTNYVSSHEDSVVTVTYMDNVLVFILPTAVVSM